MADGPSAVTGLPVALGNSDEAAGDRLIDAARVAPAPGCGWRTVMRRPGRSTSTSLQDLALQGLAAWHPRQSQFVELRLFGGLSVEETASVLGAAPIMKTRDWAVARAWVCEEIEEGTTRISTSNASMRIRRCGSRRIPPRTSRPRGRPTAAALRSFAAPETSRRSTSLLPCQAPSASSWITHRPRSAIRRSTPATTASPGLTTGDGSSRAPAFPENGRTPFLPFRLGR